MDPTFDAATVHAVRHYLDRTADILRRLAQEPEPDALLAIRIAPDMFETGFNFAVAIQFAARALCLPARIEVPDIPDDFTCDTLLAYAKTIAKLIEPIGIADFDDAVSHIAGEAALTQDVPDYILRFALPNMIFHLSMAYAGLRHGGLPVGKADFDGLHVY